MNGITSPNRTRSCRRAACRGGYTLLEMIVASTTGAILLAGLSGSLYIASQGFDQNNTQTHQMQAQQILSGLMADLNHAISFSERTASAVTFTVPDRTADSLPETIRYAWGGSIGDPLTYEYNGSAVVTLSNSVQNFDLRYLTRTMTAAVSPPPDGADKLLLVVTDTFFPNSQERARQTLFENWGYSVTRINDGDSQANYDTKLAENDLVYVSREISDSDLDTKLVGATIGVVNEKPELVDEMGFSTSSTPTTSAAINLTDNTHYITDEFALGSISLVTSDQPMTAVSGTLAAGLGTLGQWGADPGLAVLNSGAIAHDGSTVAGRRVALPWGGSSFDSGLLTSDGQTMLRKAIEWAGGAGDAISAGVVFEEFTEKKASSNTTNLTTDLPAGTAEGDLLIAAVATDGNTKSSLSGPAGWNLIVLEERFDAVTFAVWWKLAGSSEPVSQNYTWSDSQKAYGWIMRFTGHDASNPIDASSMVTETSSSPASPAVTSTVDNAMILRLAGIDDNDINLDDPGLSGHTPITMDEAHSGSGSSSGGAGYVIQPSPGDSGTSTFSLTAEEQTVSVTIAIAPDPGN